MDGNGVQANHGGGHEPAANHTSKANHGGDHEPAANHTSKANHGGDHEPAANHTSKANHGGGHEPAANHTSKANQHIYGIQFIDERVAQTNGEQRGEVSDTEEINIAPNVKCNLKAYSDAFKARTPNKCFFCCTKECME